MRGKNGRFTKKEENEDGEVQAIERFEYTDLWIFKVIDAFTRALVGLLLRLGIQVFFILLFAVILKKVGMFDLMKEIVFMISDVLNYAKGTHNKDDSNVNSNGGADKKSYFS